VFLDCVKGVGGCEIFQGDRDRIVYRDCTTTRAMRGGGKYLVAVSHSQSQPGRKAAFRTISFFRSNFATMATNTSANVPSKSFMILKLTHSQLASTKLATSFHLAISSRPRPKRQWQWQQLLARNMSALDILGLCLYTELLARIFSWGWDQVRVRVRVALNSAQV